MRSSKPLRVLLTNIALREGSGTETVTRDLAIGLLRAGHRPAVYTTAMGRLADELRAISIPIVDRIENLEGEFEVIHGHHLVVCQAVLARFPFTPAISVCHDFNAWWDIPVKLPNIVTYVAVSENLVERLNLENAVPSGRIRLILNGVDTERFAPGGPLPPKPKRALAFAKNREHVPVIRDVCRERNIAVDFIGSAVGEQISAPERCIPNYDLVFASALSAIEAMSCLRPVIVCDGRGLAGLVNLDRYSAWRSHNFGLKVLQGRVTASALRQELDQYDPTEAVQVGARLREDANLAKWVSAYVELYREGIAHHDSTRPFDKRAWALHLQTWSPRATQEWPWIQEHERLQSELQRLLAGLERFPLDRPLSFGAQGGIRDYVRATGLHAVEDWGVWTGHEVVELRLQLPRETELMLELTYMPFLPDDKSTLNTSVLLDAALLDEWTDSHWSPRMMRRFRVPARDEHALNTSIIIKTSPLRAPNEYGSEDTRRLGLGLISICAQSCHKRASILARWSVRKNR